MQSNCCKLLRLMNKNNGKNYKKTAAKDLKLPYLE